MTLYSSTIFNLTDIFHALTLVYYHFTYPPLEGSKIIDAPPQYAPPLAMVPNCLTQLNFLAGVTVLLVMLANLFPLKFMIASGTLSMEAYDASW